MSKMIKNIFLDAGGVILDESGHEEIRSRISVGLLSKIYREYTETSYWEDVAEAARYFVPSVYKYVFWKNAQNTDLCSELWKRYQQEWEEKRTKSVLMKGLADTVECLSRQYAVGILGQYTNELRDLLDEKGILKYFTFGNTQDEFSLAKPDPRYFEQVVRKAEARPEECIMVGDRIDMDIIPARMIGMTTVRVKTGIHKAQQPRLPEECPDYEIENITEMKNIKVKVEI